MIEIDAADDDREQRFAALSRVYGGRNLAVFGELHVCVVGVGGVRSWAVEALARSGVGRLTIIDNDRVTLANVNRQLPALTETLDRHKVDVLSDRVHSINPHCQCTGVCDFLTDRTLEAYLGSRYDCVIDGIDSIKFKVAMVAFCVRAKLPMVCTGGAGGRIDPSAVRVRDLSRTEHDPLAARVRSRIRNAHGFPRNPRRRFGVDCVFSMEQPLYPRADGSVGREKPGIHGVHLDCHLGYGSVVTVTATFGMMAAARALALGLRNSVRRCASDTAVP